MYCMKCGAQIPDGSEFCMNCGARISQIEETKVSQPVNTNIDKLKVLCSKYKGEYLFEDADRFVSIVADMLPEDEETVDLMYRCVGGSTGKYLRVLAGKSSLTPEDVEGLNQWICEDTGVNNGKAKELTQDFMAMLGTSISTAQPAPAPRPAPAPQPTPAPRPVSAPKSEPAQKKNGKLTYTVMQKNYAEVPANIAIPQAAKKTTGKEARQFIFWALACVVITVIMRANGVFNLFAYLIAFASPILIIAAIVDACTGTKLTVDERTGMSGDRHLVCSFKAKSKYDYAIAVDDCWIAEHVESGFAFKIQTPGTHRIMLVANRTKCMDYEEITIR